MEIHRIFANRPYKLHTPLCVIYPAATFFGVSTSGIGIIWWSFSLAHDGQLENCLSYLGLPLFLVSMLDYVTDIICEVIHNIELSGKLL
jgi:hypothetical protein